MNEKFYSWLVRKYGIGKETFCEIEKDDAEFAESLIREYSSIAISY